MGQIKSKVDLWEIQLVNAKRLGKDHVVVNVVTAEEEKALNNKGYTIEHIEEGSKKYYLIKRKQ